LRGMRSRFHQRPSGLLAHSACCCNRSGIISQSANGREVHEYHTIRKLVGELFRYLDCQAGLANPSTAG